MASITSGRVVLQSMADFEREQEEIDSQRPLQESKSSAVPQPQVSKKKKKNTPDVRVINALVIENCALEEMGESNWVGRLLEYRAAHPLKDGLSYTEHFVGDAQTPRFACTVLIEEHPEPFGGISVSFGTKKNAKQYASKKAIDWLIQNKHMPDDGSVKFPKAAIPQAPLVKPRSPVAAAAAEDGTKPKSWASQVPDLCFRLGFSPPAYEMTKVIPTGGIWDGYAHFGGDPRIMGKVGEVKNVNGQKAAKEEIAREVVKFLKSIESHRLGLDGAADENDAERKRKRGSMEEAEMGEQIVKAAKPDKPHAADFF